MISDCIPPLTELCTFLRALNLQLLTPASLSTPAFSTVLNTLNRTSAEYAALSSKLQWDAEAPCAKRLLTLLGTYQTLLTTCLEKVLTFLTLFGSLPLANYLTSLVVRYSQTLHFYREEWPPFHKVTPALLVAVCDLERRLRTFGVKFSWDWDHNDETSRFLVNCLVNCLEGFNGNSFHSLPPDMLGNFIQSATDDFRTRYPDQARIPETLLLLMSLRAEARKLGTHNAPMNLERILCSSELAAARAARVIIINLAESSIDIPKEKHLMMDQLSAVLSECCLLPIASSTSSESRCRDALLINSIHTLGLKYPDVAHNSSELIIHVCGVMSRGYTRRVHSGEVAVLHSGAYACVSRVCEILRTRKGLLQETAATSTASGLSRPAAARVAMVAVTAAATTHMHAEQLLLSYAVSLVAKISENIPDVGLQPVGCKKLVKEISMPGILSVLEEFARTRSLTTITMSLYHHLALSNTSDPTATAQLISLSAAHTAHKRILRMCKLKSPWDINEGVILLQMAEGMARVLASIVLHGGGAGVGAYNYRLYFLVGTSLQALRANSLGNPCRQALLQVVQGLTDQGYRIPIYKDGLDRSYRHDVSRCAELFGGIRLLQNCGHLNCTNLSGVMDAALPTQLCARCQHVRYCSIACQRADWALGGHKLSCVDIAC